MAKTRPSETAETSLGVETGARVDDDTGGFGAPRPGPGDERLAEASPLVVRARLFWRSSKKNWSLFAQNKIGLLGLGIITVFALMGIAHPVLMNTVWDARIYDPVNGYHAPVTEKEVVAEGEVVDRTTQIDIFTAQLEGSPMAEVGETIMVPEQPAKPSSTHLLGTDPLGRDVLSQLLYGTRSAFAMAAVAAIVTVVLATLVGSVAAYYSGAVDASLMRVADLFLLIPLIPVLVFVAGLFNLTLVKLGVIIGVLAGLGPVAIIMKSQALTVKVKPFIEAARVAGGNDVRIITRHIIPNVLPLSFLYMMFTVTDAILSEATLSFFGLMDIPMSWGIMIHTAQNAGYLLRGTEFWWLLLPAGFAVTLLAMGFYLVGRGLDEVVNPRLRQR